MTDYWVSKLFFDLQQDAKLAAEYRADMPGVLARYEIKPDVRQALLEDDVGKSRRSSTPIYCASISRSAACRKTSSSPGCTRSRQRKERRMADLVGAFAASHG